MRARVLGPVDVRVGGAWVPPTGRLQRTLLGVLLARAGLRVSSDYLVGALWGDERDEQAHARLQVLVHRLRKLLGDPDLVITDNGGYRLALPPEEVDWQVFDRLAAAVLAPEDAESRLDSARQALALWRGAAFDGVDDELCVREAERLSERRLAVAEVLYAEEVARGNHGTVLADLSSLAGEHPLRESLQALLMNALHQGGRQAEALEVYRHTRTRLVEELGVTPSQVLLDMHDRVLAGNAMSAPSDTLPRPAQMPAPPRALTGRAGAQEALDGSLLGDRAASVVVLCGAAGVGKSALALAWAHSRLDAFPDGQLFVDLQGFGRREPVGAEQVLDGFLRALGANPKGLRGIEERSAQLRSMVSGQRMLMVLDNARTAEQVRPLLPGSATVKVLVTSRQSMPGLAVRDGAERIGLGLLSPADAVSLLSDLVEMPTAPGQLERLAQRCGHLPLALRVAAERVNDDPQGVWSVLQSGDGALDVLEAGDDPSSSAREVFSWSYRAMSPPAGRVFRSMGVLPGGSADLAALEALSGLSADVVSAGVAELARAHLVEVEDGRCRQHDLLAEYAAECAHEEELPATRDEMLTRLLAHYVVRAVDAERVVEFDDAGTGFETPGQALEWLDHNRDSIAFAAEAAPVAAGPLVVKLVQHLRRHLNNGGHRAPARRLYDAATAVLAAGAELRDAPVVEGAIGGLLVRTGEIERGRVHLDRAMRLSVLGGDIMRQATALNNLGVMSSTTGHMHEAERFFRDSWALCLEAGEPVLGMTPQSNVASLLIDRAEYEADRASLGEGLAMLEELAVTADRDGLRAREVFCLRAIGLANLHRGDVSTALDSASRAGALARELGDLVNEGEAEVALGRVHLACGDPPAAQRHLGRAVALARPVGEVQIIVEAQLWLACVRARSDPAAAVPLFEECAALARRFGLGLREADACMAEAAARDEADLSGADRLRARARALFAERDLDTTGRRALTNADADVTRVAH